MQHLHTFSGVVWLFSFYCLSPLQKNCQTMGAHLASVHTADENYDIQMMIAKVTKVFGRTWLGGSDCQKVYYLSSQSFKYYLFVYLFVAFVNSVLFQEGIWLWSDGTSFNYQHCGTFDNRWWKQHCLQMNYGGKLH